MCIYVVREITNEEGNRLKYILRTEFSKITCKKIHHEYNFYREFWKSLFKEISKKSTDNSCICPKHEGSRDM